MLSLIILIILLFGILMGLRRGFILQSIHLVGFLISFIIASLYYKKLAEHLSLWIPYPDLINGNTWAIFLNELSLENAFYHAIAFGIVFFISKIILQIIASMLDFVARFPVLKQLNQLLGAVLGFFEIYIITFIVLFILALIPIQLIQEKISSSFLAKFIIQHTPILSKAIESLMFTESVSFLF